jgi:PPOX class probable F420-dependent enzyme
MQKMSKEEIRDFLTREVHTGKVATVRADGRPHVAPIWFVMDGEDLIFTTWHTTVKAANLRHEPRLSICVDDEKPPYAFVIFEGVASMVDEAPDKLYWTTRIAGKYMGEDQADAFGKRNAVPGELLVRVRPTYVVAQKEISA